MSTIEIPFRLLGNSVILEAKVNGVDAEFVLDTSYALGPVFSGGDFQRYNLLGEGPVGVPGVGTTSRTHADIVLGGAKFDHEEAVIDLSLQGISRLGLPFFLANAKSITIDFDARTLTVVSPDEPALVPAVKPPAPKPAAPKVPMGTTKADVSTPPWDDEFAEVA